MSTPLYVHVTHTQHTHTSTHCLPPPTSRVCSCLLRSLCMDLLPMPMETGRGSAGRRRTNGPFSVSSEDGNVSIGYLLTRRLVCSDYAKGSLYVRRALHCIDWLHLEQSWNSRCWRAQLFVTERTGVYNILMSGWAAPYFSPERARADHPGLRVVSTAA